MKVDYGWGIWLPAALVLSSLYALIFRLPAVLRGREREEYFLNGWLGAMVVMAFIGMLVAIVMLDLYFFFRVLVIILFGAAILYALILPFILIVCSAKFGEYYDLLTNYPAPYGQSVVRSGVRDALREHDREREYTRDRRRRPR